MSLSDFISNVSDSIRYGTWRDELAEFGEINRQFAADMAEVMEDGEELFTDGFEELVVKDGTEWQPSSEVRHEAQATIKSARDRFMGKHLAYLEERAATRQRLVQFGEWRKNALAEATTAWQTLAAEHGDNGLGTIVAELSAAFTHLPFDFAAQFDAANDAPSEAPPEPEAPPRPRPSLRLPTIPPIELGFDADMHTPLVPPVPKPRDHEAKDERVAAARQFAEAAETYVATVDAELDRIAAASRNLSEWERSAEDRRQAITQSLRDLDTGIEAGCLKDATLALARLVQRASAPLVVASERVEQ